MKTLHEIGLEHQTDKATHHGYCDFYQAHLPKKVERLLEIGVMDGASLRMWRDYFPNAQVIGVDIKERYDIEGVEWLKIDATTPEVQELGMFDVIIDDGSHMTSQQQASFKLLWEKVNEGGIYIMEDIHTSYMEGYVDSPKNTHEFLRDLEAEGFDVTYWSRTSDCSDSFTAIIKK